MRSVPIVDRVTDAFFALDTGFRFTYLNERAETLLKRSRARELIGRVMWDEFPQTVETQFPEGFHRAMDEQVPVSSRSTTPPRDVVRGAAYPSSETGLSVYMRRQRAEGSGDDAGPARRGRRGDPGRRRHARSQPRDRHRQRRDRVDLWRRPIATRRRAHRDADRTGRDRRRTRRRDRPGDHRCRRRQRRPSPARAPHTGRGGDDRMGEFRFVPVEDNRATVAVVVRDVTDQHEYDRVVTSLHEVTRWLLESDDPEEICAIAVHWQRPARSPPSAASGCSRRGAGLPQAGRRHRRRARRVRWPPRFNPGGARLGHLRGRRRRTVRRPSRPSTASTTRDTAALGDHRTDRDPRRAS